jgi:hypothetical protein
VMAWNTAQMQAVLDRWAHRRQVVPPELIGRISPTRLEGINLRGVFRFPIERYADQLLPSQTAANKSARDLKSTTDQAVPRGNWGGNRISRWDKDLGVTTRGKPHSWRRPYRHSVH